MLLYKNMTVRWLIVLIFVSVSNIHANANSDFTSQGFKMGLIRGLADPEKIEAKLNVYGLHGPQRDVARQYLEDMARNQKYVGYLENHFSEAMHKKKSQKEEPDKFSLSVKQLLEVHDVDKYLFINGLQRLSDKTRKEYLSLLETAYLKIDSRYCRHLMYDIKGSEMLALEASLQMLSVFSINELRRYFNIAKLAVDSELDKFPSKLQLTEGQSNLSAKSFDNLLRASYVTLGQPEFLLSLTKPDASTNDDLCLAGAHVTKIVRQMTGKEGEWFRYKFLQ